MNIRTMMFTDIDELRRIHEKFFSKEFPFHDLFGNALSSYVVTDDNDKIITGGQVRVIAEATIVTDKDIEIEQRRQALIKILQASMFACSSRGFNQLHAFVQDDNWIRHLKRFGFRETVGKSLVIPI